MRLATVILTIAALLACSEAWSIDFHIDAGHDHGTELVDGPQDDAPDHGGEACGHGHCHHSALLAVIQSLPMPIHGGPTPDHSATPPPLIATRHYRPPIS